MDSLYGVSNLEEIKCRRGRWIIKDDGEVEEVPTEVPYAEIAEKETEEAKKSLNVGQYL